MNLTRLRSPRSSQTFLRACTKRTRICASNLPSWRLSSSSLGESLALENLLGGISFRSHSILDGTFLSLTTNEERRIASFESVDKCEVNMFHITCVHFTHQFIKWLLCLVGLKPKLSKSFSPNSRIYCTNFLIF